MRVILIFMIAIGIYAEAWVNNKFQDSEERALEINVLSVHENCGNGKVDLNEECDSLEVANGQCLECIVVCNSGFTKRKTLYPFDGEKKVCSAYVVNNDPCGKYPGTCSHEHPIDYNYRPGIGERSWKCGNHICYE